MELLQAGVDCAVIALWLGHESIETTQTYLHTHLALKEAALAKLQPYERGKRTRFRPSDRLLAFLEALKKAKLCRMEFGRCPLDGPQIRANDRSHPEPFGIVRRAA